MTHALTNVKRFQRGNRKEVQATLTISSYTASGEALTAAEFGLVGIEDMVITPGSVSVNNIFYWDGAKARAMVCTTGAEVAGATNIGATKVRVLGF